VPRPLDTPKAWTGMAEVPGGILDISIHWSVEPLVAPLFADLTAIYKPDTTAQDAAIDDPKII